MPLPQRNIVVAQNVALIVGKIAAHLCRKFHVKPKAPGRDATVARGPSDALDYDATCALYRVENDVRSDAYLQVIFSASGA